MSVIDFHQRAALSLTATGEQALAVDVIEPTLENVISAIAERQLASGGFCLPKGINT